MWTNGPQQSASKERKASPSPSELIFAVVATPPSVAPRCSERLFSSSVSLPLRSDDPSACRVKAFQYASMQQNFSFSTYAFLQGPYNARARLRPALQASAPASSHSLSLGHCKALVRPGPALRASAPAPSRALFFKGGQCVSTPGLSPCFWHTPFFRALSCTSKAPLGSPLASGSAPFFRALSCTSKAPLSTPGLCPCLLALAFLGGPAVH